MSLAGALRAPGPRRAPAPNKEPTARSFRARLASGGLALLAAAVLLFLWQIRGEGHLSPKSGIGYALGIAGVIATLLLLSYPLRKRLRFMRGWGRVESWFRLHMVLGLVAPALILIHCNFALGSLNSSVALVSMLVVAASGIVGRVIYTRIHFGLYGARATLEQLREIVADHAREAGAVLEVCPDARLRLVEFADRSLAPPTGVLAAALRILLIGPRAWWLRLSALRALSKTLSRQAREDRWTRSERREERRAMRNFVSAFLATIRKTVQFSFYERIFSLWHVLHIPLFFMMLIATAVHIVAVHMY